jgi:hypothetical protein
MKMSILEMVQDILSDMSSDSVNSIGDTEEALQVTNILKSTYNEMMSRREWPHLKEVAPLESFSDSRYPTHLLLPENTRKVEWITYNQRNRSNPNDSFSVIKYMEPNAFIQWTNSRNSSGEGVVTVQTVTDVPFKILSNTPPTYWTSFNDKYIIMDSYESLVEDTLQGSQAQTEIYLYPNWETSDSFVPNLPGHLFPALLAEAKSTCFYILKQTANEKAEQQSKRQQNKMSMSSWVTNGGLRYPDYGRRR